MACVPKPLLLLSCRFTGTDGRAGHLEVLRQVAARVAEAGAQHPHARSNWLLLVTMHRRSHGHSGPPNHVHGLPASLHARQLACPPACMLSTPKTQHMVGHRRALRRLKRMQPLRGRSTTKGKGGAMPIHRRLLQTWPVPAGGGCLVSLAAGACTRGALSATQLLAVRGCILQLAAATPYTHASRLPAACARIAPHLCPQIHRQHLDCGMHVHRQHLAVACIFTGSIWQWHARPQAASGSGTHIHRQDLGNGTCL